MNSGQAKRPVHPKSLKQPGLRNLIGPGESKPGPSKPRNLHNHMTWTTAGDCKPRWAVAGHREAPPCELTARRTGSGTACRFRRPQAHQTDLITAQLLNRNDDKTTATEEDTANIITGNDNTTASAIPTATATTEQHVRDRFATIRGRRSACKN